MSADLINPYMGPRTFEEENGRFFHGRRQEAADLRSFVIAEQVVLLHSPSGAGKSSLIKARLIPDLRKAGFTVLPVGRLAGELPADGENVNNIFVFNLLWSLADENVSIGELCQMTLLDYFHLLSEPPTVPGQSGAPRLLVIDQFEEILTTYPERWQEREQFFYQLGQALRKSEALWVLFAIREEFVAALQPFGHYLPGGFEARYYLRPLLPEAAREAIEEPARQGGRPFTPGVAHILVNNLRQIHTVDQSEAQLGQFVEPVQLQIVCSELWRNLRNKPAGQPITQEDIRELGGAATAVDTALAQFYCQTLDAVCQQHTIPELTLRRWFRTKLITETRTRGRVPQGVQETGGLDNKIVKSLTDQFLLRADARGGTVWCELVHDRFIAAIIQDNNRWLEAHPLIQAAENWEQSGHKPERLYLGKQLEDALAKNPDLTKVDALIQAFLEAGQKEQARLEEIQKDDERQKRYLLLRKRLFILGIAALAILLLFLFALFQNSQADTSRQNANLDSTRAIEQAAAADAESTRVVDERATAVSEEFIANEQQATAVANSTRAAESRLTAEAARNSAEEQQATAVANSTRAAEQAATVNADSTRVVEQAAIAEAASTQAVEQRATADIASTQTARQSDLLLSQSLALRALDVTALGNDYELATLLAVEANLLNEGEDNELQTTIEAALSLVRDAREFNLILRGHEGAVNQIAFSDDGQLLATAGEDGTIRLWNMSDLALPAEILRGHEGAIKAVLFTDENKLISTGEDGKVLEWDLMNTIPSSVVLVEEETAVLAMDYAPGGQGRHRYLVLSRVDGLVNLWDIDLPRPTPAPLTVADGIYHPAVFFAQSGYFVVVGKSDGTINEWPAYNPYLSPTTRGNEPHTSPITALAHNHAPDRNDMTLASGSSRINIDPDENNFILDGHLGFIAALDFATEFDLLASGGDDGLVNIWQISSRTVWRSFRGHVGRVTAVAFSPDDAWLASAGAEGLVRLWRLRLPTAEDISLAELACQQIHRNLTWEEWQLYVNRPLYRPTCPNLPVSPSVPPEALAAQTNSALSSLDISIIVLSFSGLFITWQRQRYRV